MSFFSHSVFLIGYFHLFLKWLWTKWQKNFCHLVHYFVTSFFKFLCPFLLFFLWICSGTLWVGLLRWRSGKESTCHCRKYKDCRFDPRVRKSPWNRKWQLATPVFLPGKFHRQRSLAGCSPWGCKQSNTTEQLSSYTCFESF